MRAKTNQVRVARGEMYTIEYRKKGQWLWRVYAHGSDFGDIAGKAKRIAASFDRMISRHEKREKPIYFQVKP